MLATPMTILRDVGTSIDAATTTDTKEIEAGHGIGYYIGIKTRTGTGNITVKFQRRIKGVTTWEDVFPGHATITITTALLPRFLLKTGPRGLLGNGQGYQSIHSVGMNDIAIASAAEALKWGLPNGADGSGLWEHRAIITPVSGTEVDLIVGLFAWPGLSINEGLAA